MLLRYVTSPNVIYYFLSEYTCILPFTSLCLQDSQVANDSSYYQNQSQRRHGLV